MANDFNTGFARMLNQLSEHWKMAQSEWRDEVARRFERQEWAEIHDAGQRLASALSDIQKEIESIERDLDAN